MKKYLMVLFLVFVSVSPPIRAQGDTPQTPQAASTPANVGFVAAPNAPKPPTTPSYVLPNGKTPAPPGTLPKTGEANNHLSFVGVILLSGGLSLLLTKKTHKKETLS